MKSIIGWIIVIIIGAAFIFFIKYGRCYADDYIVTDYGQGVFSVEHDGVMHIQGRGEAGNNLKPEYTDKRNNDTESESESSLSWFLAEAKQLENKGAWAGAASYYKKANETEKMEEMAYKDIDMELAKIPPNYKMAMWTAELILENEELAMKYYDKSLDQQFNSGVQ